MITKNNWRLVTAAGMNISEGMILLDFRGEEHTLKGGEPPHKPSSTGRVWTDHGEFFPNVFGLEWRREPITAFTVLLLRPDYIAEPYGQDTYHTWVGADSPEAAVKVAQQEAFKTDNPGQDEWASAPEDYFPLAVYEGHLTNHA